MTKTMNILDHREWQRGRTFCFGEVSANKCNGLTSMRIERKDSFFNFFHTVIKKASHLMLTVWIPTKNSEYGPGNE